MHQWRGHSLINKSKKNSANKDENAAPTKSLNHARSDTNHNNGKMDNVNKDEIMHQDVENSNRIQSNKDIKETKD